MIAAVVDEYFLSVESEQRSAESSPQVHAEYAEEFINTCEGQDRDVDQFTYLLNALQLKVDDMEERQLKCAADVDILVREISHLHKKLDDVIGHHPQPLQ